MENSTIKPNVLLNGNQLVEFSRKLQDYSIKAKGQKYEEYDETREDILANIEESTENLRELLKLERILMANKRSKGIYEETNNRVRITTLLGKFNWIGYIENNITYLRPHEALLLIEMNRLEVKFNDVTISVEQAYAIFLSDKCELTFEEYFIYSVLMRIGYGVLIHDLDFDRQKYLAIRKRNKVKKEDEMIWCVLMEELQQPINCDHNLIANERDLYLKTKANMQQHFAAISGRCEPNMENCNKDEPPSKKIKFSNKKMNDSFLDILKSDLEYLSYKQIFQKFSYITQKQFDDSSACDLKLSFDIFLPKANCKRSEELAAYRIFVLSSSSRFPTHSQLEALRMKQAYDVPIIIAAISESMAVHYTVCTF